MTELKTLNSREIKDKTLEELRKKGIPYVPIKKQELADISEMIWLTLLHFEKELKAEAVKWVKFHRSKPILNACAVEDWIINFFNLTEEDLATKEDLK